MIGFDYSRNFKTAFTSPGRPPSSGALAHVAARLLPRLRLYTARRQRVGTVRLVLNTMIVWRLTDIGYGTA